MSDRGRTSNQDSHWKALMAGAGAGLAVDITLFPIDTIKTRLQSPNGFWKSGGFSRIYLGIGSTISGSAPGAALFFFTYESVKHAAQPYMENHSSLRFMLAASLGESVACLIRVPVEVVKQRAQAYGKSSLTVLSQTIQHAGVHGLYRGYTSTIMREIPFSMIQFPLWEWFKMTWSQHQGTLVLPYQSMLCGSLAGGISAFLTTPLDVAKTQIMLQDFKNISNETTMPVNYAKTISSIFRHSGLTGLFAGAIPRVVWISVGGAIFLGGYEQISFFLR